MMLGINAAAVVEEALTYFGCRDEWYMIAGSVCRRKRLKEKLNGKLVEQTTGLKGIVIRDIIAACWMMVYARLVYYIRPRLFVFVYLVG